MKIFILGGTGFIGRRIVMALMQEGHKIILLVHKTPPNFSQEMKTINGNARYPGKWQEVIKEADAVVNLAGVPVDPPWNSEAKNNIYRSRVDTTHNVVNALKSGQLLINASAIGYYGFRGNESLSESSGRGDGFLATVCGKWEAEAHKACTKGARVIIARFGVILGLGGMLEQLVRQSRFFLGSRLGSGKQWFSWVHSEDLVNAVLYFIKSKEQQKIYNVCSPYPVRNQKLMQVTATLLKKPSLVPIPATILKITLGEFADIVLRGQKVFPNELLKEDFRFNYPHIQETLEHLLEQFLLSKRV